MLRLIFPGQISRINLIGNIAKYIRIKPVGNDDIALRFKPLQIIYDYRIEERASILQCRLIDDHRNAFCLNALHHALNSRSPEVIGIALHGKAIHTDYLRLPRNNLVCNEILPNCVTLYNCLDHGMLGIFIVDKQLLCIFQQAIATISKTRIVVMTADSRIHTSAVNDYLGVKALRLCVSIQFIKVRNPHSQISIGKKLDRLCFCRMSNENSYILVLCAFPEKSYENPGIFPLSIFSSDYNAERMEVIIKSFCLSQELRIEDDILCRISL